MTDYTRITAAIGLLVSTLAASAATVQDAAGKPAGESVEVTAVVTGRVRISENLGYAFIQDDSGGIAVRIEGGAVPKAGDEVTVSGTVAATSGPSIIKAGSVKVTTENKGFPRVKLVSADALKDPAALAEFEGQYVVVTNVTYAAAPAEFEAGTQDTVSGAAGEKISTPVSLPLNGRKKPAHALNLFGVLSSAPIEGISESGYHLVPTRFVPEFSRDRRMLATKHTCITCHLPDKKLVGPAYIDVAAKYKDDPDATVKMIKQMENGGAGQWGPIPMLPFKGRVPPNEMADLAEWIYEMRWDTILND